MYLLTGIMLGEILSNFVLDTVFQYSLIGAFEFLDVLAMSVAGLTLWISFETITVFLDSLIQKRVKEKQG